MSSMSDENPSVPLIRRNYLIDPRFQFSILAFFISLAIINNVIFVWVSREIFLNLKSVGEELGPSFHQTLSQLIATQQNKIFFIILVNFLLLVVFMGVG